MVKTKPWVGVAKIPKEAGYVRAIQVYHDGIHDHKTVLQCEHGNWMYDASKNMMVPLIGKTVRVDSNGRGI